MPLSPARHIFVRHHPGSTAWEIAQEPEWGRGHNHRIGYRNRDGRYAGLTHDGDHDPYVREEDRKFAEEAMRKHRELRQRSEKGGLVNFQDIIKSESVGVPLSLGSIHSSVLFCRYSHKTRTSMNVDRTSTRSAGGQSFTFESLGSSRNRIGLVRMRSPIFDRNV